MDTTVEHILVVVAAIPGIYGFICWFRRTLNARKAAMRVKDTHAEEWNKLHWLARRHHQAGLEILVNEGRISGRELNAYRQRDEYLEKATWIGLLISAMLLLVIVLLKFVVTAPG